MLGGKWGLLWCRMGSGVDGLSFCAGLRLSPCRLSLISQNQKRHLFTHLAAAGLLLTEWLAWCS